MAKELPYFKFEPNQWDSGMIQLCSLQAKGLFIEICCLYWSRVGDLPYALALQKLCNGNSSLLQELEKNQIYDIENENIVIKFLDEQLEDFDELKEKRRKAANARWNNANAKQVQSKRNTKRREEKIEEKKKEEYKPPTLQEFENHAKEKAEAIGIDIDLKKIRAKFYAWEGDGWKTGGKNPRKIKNWKSTLTNSLQYCKSEKPKQYPMNNYKSMI